MKAPKLTERVLVLIEEVLYPLSQSNTMPLPHWQNCLEVASYLGFDVSQNVKKLNQEIKGKAICQLQTFEDRMTVLNLLDNLVPNSTTKFLSDLEKIRERI